MKKLELVKSENFGTVQADIYSNGEDMFMTSKQLYECLEEPKGTFDSRLSRNTYLKGSEFSVTCNLQATDGKHYNTRVFNEDGIYEITMLSESPKAKEFRAWIRGVLKALRKGETTLVPTNLLDALRLAVELEEQKEQLKLESAQKDQIIGELKPKADYVDWVLENPGLVTITQIAKDYGMSGIELNKTLHALGIQYKQGEQWLLYSKYHDKGYTHSKTIPITRSDGRSDIKMQTKWTQKGRLFIYEALKADGILPVIERLESTLRPEAV